MKILIVDDVLFTRLVVEEAIKIAESKGKIKISNIEQAESYKEAEKKLQRGQFNFIITDINLKDGLGTELAKFVKRKYPESKVIALTMYPEEFEKYKDVFDEFIEKPISSEELEEKIEKLLKER